MGLSRLLFITLLASPTHSWMPQRTSFSTRLFGRRFGKPFTDGQLAGRSADPSFAYDQATMSKPLDGFFLERFRSKLAEELGVSNGEFRPGYEGLMDLIAYLHGSGSGYNMTLVTERSRRTLNGLFPNWPPGAPSDEVGLLFWFRILFARPFPAFSAKLNAWVTWLAAQWLMGPCSLDNLDVVGGRLASSTATPLAKATAGPILGDGRGQKLVVHRCRFLEESGCASICVHTCKLPTQEFFNEDMGVPLRMIPNYESFECVFEFGVTPTDADTEDARKVPCLGTCPAPRMPTSRRAPITGDRSECSGD